jgi:hypothetical protein
VLKGVTAYSLHPGIVSTGLQSGAGGVFGTVLRPLVRLFSRTTPLEGSYNTLFAATSAEAITNAGGFFMPVGQLEKKQRPLFEDRKGNDELWELGNDQMRKALV